MHVFYYFEFTASASPAYRVSDAGVIGGRVLIETPRLSIVSGTRQRGDSHT